MLLSSMARLVARRRKPSTPGQSRPAQRQRRRWLELLEDRTLLSAYVLTDQPDYAPGATAIITGGEWLAGETVTLQVLHADGTLDTGAGHEAWSVAADADGGLATSWIVCSDDCLGSTLRLSATGSTSGFYAETLFTDGVKVGSVVVGSQSPNPVTAGNSATYLITVNRGTGPGSSGSFVAGLTITFASGTPTGVTATFTPASVSFTSSDTTKTASLQLNTTGSTPGGSYAFTVTATRNAAPGDFASGSGTLVVTGGNQAPSVGADSPSVTVNEGQTATNTGTYSDTNTGDNVTITASIGTVTKTGTNSGSWSWSLGTSDGPSQSQAVTITANDGNGGVTTTSFSLVVNNVIPTAGVTGPSAAVSWQTLTYTLSASDVSSADQAAGFAYNIDWDGDNTVDQTISASAGNGAGINVTHLYPNPGSYTVKVTATDKDGGTSTLANQAVTINTAMLQSDPVYSGQTMLIIGGCATDDLITVDVTSTPGVLVVKSYGTPVGTFSPTSRIVVNVGDGNDGVEIEIAVTMPAWLYGGKGNDILIGSSGSSVILGEDGDDRMRGRDYRDVMIGGDGVDLLVGKANEDILIGGTTSFDNDPTALAAILAEWLSSRTYTERVANLNGTGSGPRLNGSTFLQADVTVLDDGDGDTLTGSTGKDWFFANTSGGGSADVITDLTTLEVSLDVD